MLHWHELAAPSAWFFLSALCVNRRRSELLLQHVVLYPLHEWKIGQGGDELPGAGFIHALKQQDRIALADGNEEALQDLFGLPALHKLHFLLYQPGRAADRGDAAVGKGDEDEGVGHGGLV